VPPDIFPQVARATLADEAFALHFLQDSFAAGQITGTWRNSAVRKGTHDYYNEHGLEVDTWDHHRYVALGDAYMQPEDAERAAAAVRHSLAELASAVGGKITVSIPADVNETEPEGFDVFQATRFPSASGGADILAVVPIIAETPEPGLEAAKENCHAFDPSWDLL
jgi:hypothetical protein